MHTGDIIEITGQWRVVEARGDTLDVTDQLIDDALLSHVGWRIRIQEERAKLVREARPKGRDWIRCVVRVEGDTDVEAVYRVRFNAYMGVDKEDQLWLHNEEGDFFTSRPESQCHLVEWPEDPRAWW